MKRLSTSIFLILIAIFTAVLLILFATVSLSFNRLYSTNMSGAMQQEFDRVVDSYCNDENPSALTEYTTQTDSPILIISEDHKLFPSTCLNFLRTITIKLHDGTDAIIPSGYLYTLYGYNLPTLHSGMMIEADLVKLGRSNYYLPLNLTFEGTSYKHLSNTKAYGDQAIEGEDKYRVIALGRMTDNVGLSTTRSEFMLQNIQDLLIRQTDTEEYLESLSNQVVSSGDYDYQFIFKKAERHDEDLYFLTVRRIVISGYEYRYFTKTFGILFLTIGAALIAASAIIAKSISRPVENLETIADKYSHVDFSHRADIKRKDELGNLAVSINTMADNLENALTELKESNRQLGIETEKATDNEERMRELLIDLAHEFKTPLGLVSTYMEAIELGLTDRPDEYFGIINHEIDELTLLVNETIELARLQSGNWKVTIVEHNLNDIFANVAGKFSGKLEAEGFDLEMIPTRLIVRCDAHRIEQVISNLISNAYKYSDDRKHIIVRADADGDKARISVSNTGTLTEEQLAHVWERGYLTPNKKTRLPSQGIGLDIVRKILAAHGSEAGAHCKESIVTFWFTLDIVS